MIRALSNFLLLAVVCLLCNSLFAQDKALRERLAAAHAQYYTPTASGLTSFQCQAAIDWKSSLERWSGQSIPDDNPFLKYLQAVHLSVSDQLKGNGSLDWVDTAAPPDGKEDSIKQMREGFQTMMTGFFQSWNAYLNGSMVTLPDNTVTLTAVGDGMHLSGKADSMTIDEDFDKNTLLTQVNVISPAVKVLARPTFANTSDGLIVSSISNVINQPPTAPQQETEISIDYANVESFQLPSHIAMNVKNTALIEIDFSACHVSLADWAKKTVRH